MKLNFRGNVGRVFTNDYVASLEIRSSIICFVQWATHGAGGASDVNRRENLVSWKYININTAINRLFSFLYLVFNSFHQEVEHMLCPILFPNVVHMKDWWLMDWEGHTYRCGEQEALLYEDNKRPLEFFLVLLPFYTHIQHIPCLLDSGCCNQPYHQNDSLQ